MLGNEDIKPIADDCITSTKMIHEKYLHELDVRDAMPKGFTFDSAVVAARPDRGLRAVS